MVIVNLFNLIFMLRKKNYICLLAILAMMFGSCIKNKRDKQVLVFSKTAGFRHQSIEVGTEVIKELGENNGFKVTSTENAEDFNEENLKQYSAVIFLSTTQDVLNPQQQAVFERYIQAGGGYVGIHAAADTENHWKWYGQLVGAYFDSHPNNPNVRNASIQVVDKIHPATNMLEDIWTRKDEWYNYKSINPEINILMKLDETSYEGGTNGDNHPISWYQDFDGGRAFYTGLGHTNETFAEPLFLAHLLGGIEYAIGKNKEPDYSKSKSFLLPEENRFTKTVLATNLNEPTEMTVLDDGKILFTERKGNVKMYFPDKDTVTVIATLNVHTEFEDGLMGVALDPEFTANHWVYLYYSPAGGKSVQHLSRFELTDNKLNMESEIVMMEVPVQRVECCHTGGSIEFGAHRNLFLSTGDDTNPFHSDGYGPIDERLGRKPWDGQRSSGNTNDLRGKILRITPQADGTYTIPDGNLFPKDDPKSKAEIYVMGCRNPYRIAIDQKTGYLYWGDVGPDAGEDNADRGTRGYDEINQAREPGFFGWPYFVGNNKAYHDFNFVNSTHGELFDSNKPINSSLNNTGRTELPPAQPAFIWYPYADSPNFPIVDKGGRNAMAGPVFYNEDFAGLPKRFPEYFHKKLFIYDWIRNWILIVKMDEKGDLYDIHPFMPNTEFSNVIDMEFGPDGSLYAVEYGLKWFSQNEDARLFRIDYNGGNRSPKVAMAVDENVGAVPLTVNFKTEAIDYDNDQLTYNWTFMDKGNVGSNEQNPSFTFPVAGVFHPKVTVTDSEGNETIAEVEISVGNDKPVVSIDFDGNQTFYQDNRIIDFKVIVDDTEDGNTDDGGISEDEVFVTVDYLDQGYDKTLIEQGHKSKDGFSKFMAGKRLIDASDCKSCHQKNEKSIGPSYFQIATKYSEKDQDSLSAKIIKGGGGIWGDQAMAAHPQISYAEAGKMVEYILSIDNAKIQKGLPLTSAYTFKSHKTAKGNIKQKGTYFIRASYTDKGGDKAGPLTSDQTIILRNPEILAKDYDTNKGTIGFNIPETDFEFEIFSHDNFISFENIDLTDVKSIVMMVGKSEQAKGGKIELRFDGPDGPLVAEGNIDKNQQLYPIELVLKEAINERKDLFFKATNDDNPGQPLFGALNISFKF